MGEILVFNDLIRVFWKTEISYEGNPNYFEALSAKTLVTRIVTGAYCTLLWCTCVHLCMCVYVVTHLVVYVFVYVDTYTLAFNVC